MLPTSMPLRSFTGEPQFGHGSPSRAFVISAMWSGVKLTDAELLGMPWILTVSPRSLAAGGVEVTRRATGERFTRPISEVEAFLQTGSFAPHA
jgi:hypothetical protein